MINVATAAMADLPRARLGIGLADAMMLMSAVGNLRISQVVDPLRTVPFEMPTSADENMDGLQGGGGSPTARSHECASWSGASSTQAATSSARSPPVATPIRAMVHSVLGSDLGTASCCDEDGGCTRANRAPESLMERDGFALKGLTLLR